MLSRALEELKALRTQAKQHREVQRSLHDSLDASEKAHQQLTAKLHYALKERVDGAATGGSSTGTGAASHAHIITYYDTL